MYVAKPLALISCAVTRDAAHLLVKEYQLFPGKLPQEDCTSPV